MYGRFGPLASPLADYFMCMTFGSNTLTGGGPHPCLFLSVESHGLYSSIQQLLICLGVGGILWYVSLNFIYL